MTTPAQSQAKVFNPNAFKNPDDQGDQSSAQPSQNEQKDYPLTGNSSRDSTQETKDPKQKQYRDKGRAVLVKLKGPRFEQSRKDLRSGLVDAKTILRDDYVQGKSAPQQQNQQQQQQLPTTTTAPRMGMPGAQMGAPGFRPPGPQGMRPRMGMPGSVGGPAGFRPPGVGGFMRPPVQNIQPQQQMPLQQNVNQSPVQQQQNMIPRQNNQQHQQDEDQSTGININGSDSHQSEIKERSPIQQIQQQKQLIQENQQPPQVQQKQPKLLNGAHGVQNPINQSVDDQPADQNNMSFDDKEQVQSQNQNDSNIQQQKTNLDQSSVDNSQDKAIGIDDSIASNEKKPAKKKKKVKKGDKAKKKSGGQDKQLLDELIEDNVKSAQQINQNSDEIENAKNSNLPRQTSEIISQNQIEQQLNTNSIEDQNKEQVQQLGQNYDFLDQSSSLFIDNNKDDQNQQKQISTDEIPDNNAKNIVKQITPPRQQQSSERLNQSQNKQQELQQQQQIAIEENNAVKSKHSTIEQQNLFNSINKDANILQSVHEDIPPEHKSKQQSLVEEDVSNLLTQNKQLSVKQDKLMMSKNPSVKSLAHSSSNNTNQQQQLQQQINSANVFESDQVKRLNDSLSYKRQQIKELKEKVVHLDNDKHLQKRKADMLMDENKSIREELRHKDRELKNVQSSQNEKVGNLEIQNRKLESALKDKTQENEQLKKEVQRQKDEKQTLKDRVHSINEENSHQRQSLDHLLKALESRLSHSNVSQTTSPTNIAMGGAASQGNQSEQVDQLQREIQNMKAMYESKIRDLNDELTNKTKLLQRTERQNLTLQERNNQLQELLSQVEVQQLSTVAGSGSNQRDSTTALLNRRQGGGSMDDQLSRAYEEEGTGGDGGYGQSSQSNIRSQQQQNDYIFADEGGMSGAAVISGLNEQFNDNDSVNNQIQQQPVYDGGSSSTHQRSTNQQRNTQGYQLEAVSGGPPHQQFEDDHDQDEEGDDDEDYDRETDNGGDTGIHEDYEDEEGNQYDGGMDNNTQGIASSSQPHGRDNQAMGSGHGGQLNQSQTHNLQQTFQGDNNEGYAGGQQTSNLPPRQRKQQSRNRRGNRQQNQQHTTGQSSTVNQQQQNPRQRNSRGRQQRSNQQQIQQQQQVSQQQLGQQNAQQQQHQDTVHNAPSSAPSSQQFRMQQQQQNATGEYFQNYGDSSSVFMNPSNRDQSASSQSAINIPHTQFGQRDMAVAGSGVVHTAGRQNAIDSMMSAESGSTATAFLDKNQFPHTTGTGASASTNIGGSRGHNQPVGRQQQTTQPSSVQQLQFQTGSNNQQQYQQVVPSDLFNDNDNYTAAVGAPTSRAAAYPRQGNITQRQQPSNQNTYGVYQFQEETKQSSGGDMQPNFYQQQQNANQSSQSSMKQGNQGHSLNQYFVGGSGEQEEDSSSGYYGQQNMHQYQPHGGAGGPGSAFDSTRRNQSSVQQIRQGRGTTPTGNDSRKTSGANTPNKDRADTPTTKAYRSQQQQNSYVHNLTSNQLFFSNQDEGDSQIFGGMGGGVNPSQQQQQQHYMPTHQQQQNAQQQHHIQPQQQQQQQHFGRDPDVISSSLFE